VNVADARREVEQRDWWHTIDLAPGLTTRGWWDLRDVARRMPWPGSLAGLRCLDVGTMDGFWAFEVEARGAADVVAIDVAGEAADEHPHAETFRLAARLRGSSAVYRVRNVYDLSLEDDGEFDLVFMGYVLQLLRDPLRGLEAVRRVCRGSLILLDTVSLPLSLVPAPVARLNARRDGSEYFVFNRRGLVQALTLSGFTVEAVTPILREGYGRAGEGSPAPLAPRLMHALGIRGRSAAVRARRASGTGAR
jgi:SAM-dependent methyltransferase